MSSESSGHEINAEPPDCEIHEGSSDCEINDESSNSETNDESSDNESYDLCCHCESKYDVLFNCRTCKPKGAFCPKCRSTFHDHFKCEIVFKDNNKAAYPEDLQMQAVNINKQNTDSLTDRNHDIHTICPVDEHTLWAYDNKGTPSILFITLGEDVQCREVFRADRIFEISYSKCGYLYVTLQKQIVQIDLKGKVEKLTDCSPLACCGIFAYDSGEFVVGIIENEFDADPLHKIVKYDKFGDEISEFEYNINDEPDFIDAIPQFITVNPVNGDILILDWNGEVQNRIVALTTKGNIHWIFHGIFYEPNDSFFPNGICCTEAGNVIIMQKESVVLHPDGTVYTTALKSNTHLGNIRYITHFNRDSFFIISNRANIQKVSISGV